MTDSRVWIYLILTLAIFGCTPNSTTHTRVSNLETNNSRNSDTTVKYIRKFTAGSNSNFTDSDLIEAARKIVIENRSLDKFIKLNRILAIHSASKKYNRGRPIESMPLSVRNGLNIVKNANESKISVLVRLNTTYIDHICRYVDKLKLRDNPEFTFTKLDVDDETMAAQSSVMDKIINEIETSINSGDTLVPPYVNLGIHGYNCFRNIHVLFKQNGDFEKIIDGEVLCFL